MNNQEKFMTQSNKLKVHRENSQTISLYPIAFSADILFSSLVSFSFCLLVVFFCVCYFKLAICILIHIRLCRLMSAKKIFTGPISRSKTNFFCPYFIHLTSNLENKYESTIHCEQPQQKVSNKAHAIFKSGVNNFLCKFTFTL